MLLVFFWNLCDICKVQLSGDLLLRFVVNFLLVQKLSTSKRTKATEMMPMVGITLHNGLLNPMIVLTQLSSGSIIIVIIIIIIIIIVIVWPFWSHLKQFSVFWSLLHHQFAKDSLHLDPPFIPTKNVIKKICALAYPNTHFCFLCLVILHRILIFVVVRSFWLSAVNPFSSRVFNRQVFSFMDVHLIIKVFHYGWQYLHQSHTVPRAQRLFGQRVKA